MSAGFEDNGHSRWLQSSLQQASAQSVERVTWVGFGPRVGFLHRFFMVRGHDHSMRERGWRHPGRTGRVKEEFAMMGWYGNGMGSLQWLGMGVFWFALLGLIVWLVFRLLPGSDRAPVRATGESAMDILDRRLASGEIDLPIWQTQRGALLAAQRESR